MRTLLNSVIDELDTALRVVAAPARPPLRPVPSTTGAAAPSPELTATERRASAALMRVNHSGEIAAQALYRGQAFVARKPALRAQLLESAAEEHDHLAWCATRVAELDGRTSRLNALWYGGSFALGALAGLAGDRLSLGFLAETERQVVEHLDTHLERLPGGDLESRTIVTQMRRDEARHRDEARSAGGEALPRPARRAMRVAASFMTRISHRI